MSDAHPDIIVGLDIGTSKVCAIVARRDAENPQVVHVLGVGHSPSDGLNRGVVVNIEKTVRSIETAVQGAESQSGVRETLRSGKGGAVKPSGMRACAVISPPAATGHQKSFPPLRAWDTNLRSILPGSPSAYALGASGLRWSSFFLPRPGDRVDT